VLELVHIHVRIRRNTRAPCLLLVEISALVATVRVEPAQLSTARGLLTSTVMAIDMDPAAEAERRAERAKASLMARLELLKDRFGDARRKLDVPAQITRHPLPAIGIAFGLGLLFGMRRGSRALPAAETGRTTGGVVVGALAALGLRIVREVAMNQLAQVARQFWAEQHPPVVIEEQPFEQLEPLPH
jgi:hypothetical protein